MAVDYEILDKSGWTSTIYFLPGDPPRVCKAFNENDRANKLFPIERQAYERFSANRPPSSILRYFGVHETIPFGIILEYAENRNLSKYLWDQKEYGKPKPDARLLYRWALQTVEALEFAHSLAIFNSDIHIVNLFLDSDLNLKVGDWAGASIDGSKSYSSYRLQHRLFDTDGKDVARKTGISAATEIFALGTALYGIVTGDDPWPELDQDEDREEIIKRIREKSFPDTNQLRALGSIISDCWDVKFASMGEVRVAIESEKRLRAKNDEHN